MGKRERNLSCGVGKKMAENMPTCKSFTEIEKSCFLLYEERPQEVVKAVLKAFNITV